MDTSAVRPGQDCYFYYYSTCARGNSCAFRHEPSALTNETVCTYWKAGNCTKPHCIFRHLEVGNKKRNVTPCYWESQPQGCSKPHCPFLHQFPKDPVSQPLPVVQTSPTQKLDSGSIIVNPAKLERLQKLLPVKVLEEPRETDDGRLGTVSVKRMVVPPGAGQIARRAVTGGIKNRLGGTSESIKNRLGGAVVEGVRSRLGAGEREKVEVVEEEYNSEEDRLRKSAIKSLDLRGRIDTKGTERRVIETDSEEDSIGEKILRKKIRKREKLLLRERKLDKLIKDGKMDKVLLKERKIAKKAKKNEKERLKSRVASVIDNVKITRRIKMPGVSPKSDDFQSYLPSASDYSDLDSPGGSPDPRLISVISKTDKAGTLRSDTIAVARQTSAKHRLGDRRGRRHADLLMDDKERELSDENENDHPDTRRQIGMSRREKTAKTTYAARVLGDLNLVKENKDMRVRKSDLTEDVRKRLGSKVDEIQENSDDKKVKVKSKRKLTSESPIKNKSRKIEKSKVAKASKKSKRNVEVDTDTSTDNEKFKNLKVIKAANTSSELDRSFEKTETSALKSSLNYAPIRNRKIKLKKKALNDTADVSALLALESSQEGASKDESVGDVMKELDDFINE